MESNGFSSGQTSLKLVNKGLPNHYKIGSSSKRKIKVTKMERINCTTKGGHKREGNDGVELDIDKYALGEFILSSETKKR